MGCQKSPCSLADLKNLRTVRDWNELPATVAEADSLDIFKGRLVVP